MTPYKVTEQVTEHDPSTGLGVVYSLGISTWAEACRREFCFSPDRISRALIEDDRVEHLLLADAPRSHASRARFWLPGPDHDFRKTPDRQIVHPRRLARREPIERSTATRLFRRLDGRLHERARHMGTERPVLVTSHPVHAAVADRSYWSDVVYYGWDDWLSYPPWAERRPLVQWAYRTLAARDTNVIGVTDAIVDRIGAPRSTVVPNAVSIDDFDRLPTPPSWFRALSGPLAFYAGALEQRVDIKAIAVAAKALPDWTFCLVGYLVDRDAFAELNALPNVHVGPLSRRTDVLAMASAATVCLVPHRVTEMSVAMSPLKLYEYLAAGVPVVSADLPPIRGVSDRVVLVEPGGDYATAIKEAATMPPLDATALADLRTAHDWRERYARWRRAAFARVEPS